MKKLFLVENSFFSTYLGLDFCQLRVIFYLIIVLYCNMFLYARLDASSVI